MRNKTNFVIMATLLILASFVVLGVNVLSYAAKPMPPGPTLNPLAIPKYVNQLVIPPVYESTNVIDPITGKVIRQDYIVDMTEFYQQILPTVDALGNPTGLNPTLVWGYGGMAKDAITGASLGYFRNSPGATFEATRGIPINVTWQNKISASHMFPVDPTLHWADPNNFGMPMPPFQPYPPGYSQAQSPVPLIPHLHGGEVQSTSDGHPEAWFTWDGKQGNAYNTASPTTANSAVFYYPNTQLPTTLWYHDHALGITRINVMSGLAGFYLLRDPNDAIAPLLPSGKYEVPVVIQDRSFNLDGSMWFPPVGLDPAVHPYWQPEFFGNTIMVNGKVWPNFNVEPRQYRFRLLDGSNARFYTLSFWYKASGAIDTLLPFIQIGSDGGYLPAPVTLTSLTIAPGERADILFDFSALPAGTKIILKNTAKAPFPGGAPVDPKTVGQIMQFTVMAGTPVPPTLLPQNIWPVMPVLTPDAPARYLTLWEVMGALGPTEILLDGQKWGAPISELPLVGSTEDWYIINPTADTHPIHLHLVQFQVVSRQKFRINQYVNAWITANGGMMPPFTNPTVQIPIAPYLSGAPTPPAPNEMGWKDTIQVPPGMVTRIRVRYAPQDAVNVAPGVNLYAFDPTVGPGYVWHCHILDHEDNEMMRPYRVVQ